MPKKCARRAPKKPVWNKNRVQGQKMETEAIASFKNTEK